jgi:type II secretory pathway component PulF
MMNRFDYSAQTRAGAALSGVIEAENLEAVVQQLGSMGLVNVAVSPSKAPLSRRSIGHEDFIFFNEQLASLAQTGICLDAGLRQLARDVGSSEIQRMLRETADDIERGEPLDRALEKHGGRLPALYGRVIRAGVENGQLAGTLLNLSHHLRLLSDTRRLIAEAVTYPLTVLIIALSLFCFVLAYLVPRFKEIFLDFDTRLPGITVLMFGISDHLPQILFVLAVLMGLPILWYLTTRVSVQGQRRFEQSVHALPLLGRLIRDSVVARFMRATAFAVGSGIPLPETIRIAADATASPSACREAEQLATRVEQGESVFEACKSARLIPPIFGYTIEVCAPRNNLPEALVQLARSYEARAKYNQSILRSWLAPVLIVVVGVIIGTCILSLFMPMANLLDSVA